LEKIGCGSPSSGIISIEAVIAGKIEKQPWFQGLRWYLRLSLRDCAKRREEKKNDAVC
jgi:hypothetical protein